MAHPSCPARSRHRHAGRRTTRQRSWPSGAPGAPHGAAVRAPQRGTGLVRATRAEVVLRHAPPGRPGSDTRDWIDPSAGWAVAAAMVVLAGRFGAGPTLAAAVAAIMLALIGTLVVLTRMRHAYTPELERSAALTVLVLLAVAVTTVVSVLPPMEPLYWSGS